MFKLFLKKGVSVSLFILVVLVCPVIEAATVNVASYGAVGTGNEANASVNVTAFANAIAAAGDGGTVIVPAGVYYMNGTISLAGRTNLTLDGYGATIKRVSTGNPDKMNMIEMYYGGDGCVIKGLTIDGNRSDDTSSPWSFGILILTAVDFVVKDCNIKNCSYDGILIDADYMQSGLINRKRCYGTIENCNITNNHRNGLAITDSSGGCVVKNCYFAGNDLFGLDIEPDRHHTTKHTITDSTFDGDHLSLYGSDPAKILVWDTTVEDCSFINGANFRCYGTRNITAANNTFSGGGTILFNGAYDTQDGQGKITLIGNSIEGVTNNGINLLTNASFDSWTNGTPNNWIAAGTGTYKIESSSMRALAGTMATHLTATSGTVALKQVISVTAGKQYTFGGYISRDAVSGTAYPIISVNFLNSSNSVLKNVDLRAYYEYAKYGIYEKVMAITQAPTGAVSAEVIVGGENSGSFNAYFDGLFFFDGVGPDGGDLTLTGNKVMRFDLGRQGDTPAPDYIHVDSTTSYGYDANTGWTYGIFGTASEDYWGSWQTRNTPDELALNGLRFQNYDWDFLSGFELQVPNGTYLVTVFAGNIAWNNTGMIMMEGGGGPENLRYSVGVKSDNLYMVDVNPNKDINGDSDGYLTWTQDQNYEKHGALYYGRVATWGYNSNNPYFSAAEGLYLQDQPVTVTDGKLTVYGLTYDSEIQLLLNYIEVIKAPSLPPVSCSEVWQNGFGLSGDLNQDCHVDLRDIADFVANWLVCNDPDKLGCIRNY